jgi:plastocyanin
MWTGARVIPPQPNILLEKLIVFRRIITPFVLTSSLAACSSSTNPYSQSPTDSGDTSRTSAAQVNATPSITFTPAHVALNVGGTVTFVFGNVPHNVFFDNDPAGAPATIDGANTNVSVQRSFPVAGVYNYYCHIHPGMRGTIVVGAVTDTTMGDPPGYSRARKPRPMAARAFRTALVEYGK